MEKNNIDWHLSKSVSISVILLLLTNIVTSIWWLSGLNKDVTALTTRPYLLERVIRLEVNQEGGNDVIKKMEATLSKIDATINRIDKEQSRRGPIIVHYEKRHMGGE